MDVGALSDLLSSRAEVEPIASRDVWLARHRAVASAHATSSPLELALRAGFAADRVAYAFASGYQAALHALFPGRPREELASLCVTERGGGHPRAIEARLDPRSSGGFALSGKKRWATLGGQAGALFVACVDGSITAANRKALRVVRVDAHAPGVRRTPMAEPPFTPEIAHDEIELIDVPVAASDVLPGDGFDDYVKPFRTVEDIHVSAAVIAYAIREARAHRLPGTLVERLAASVVTLTALAGDDPRSPTVHVTLAGALDLAHLTLDELDRLWAKTESPEHARWERDRVVLSVGSEARKKRLERAWERLTPAS